MSDGLQIAGEGGLEAHFRSWLHELGTPYDGTGVG